MGYYELIKSAFKIKFDLAIYDELQVAKNHRSLTYSALQQISSKMKLGLTGTPIENNLRELKALFDLVVPTYMPPMNDSAVSSQIQLNETMMIKGHSF